LHFAQSTFFMAVCRDIGTDNVFDTVKPSLYTVPLDWISAVNRSPTVAGESTASCYRPYNIFSDLSRQSASPFVATRLIVRSLFVKPIRNLCRKHGKFGKLKFQQIQNKFETFSVNSASTDFKSNVSINGSFVTQSDLLNSDALERHRRKNTRFRPSPRVASSAAASSGNVVFFSLWIVSF